MYQSPIPVHKSTVAADGKSYRFYPIHKNYGFILRRGQTLYGYDNAGLFAFKSLVYSPPPPPRRSQADATHPL